MLLSNLTRQKWLYWHSQRPSAKLELFCWFLTSKARWHNILGTISKICRVVTASSTLAPIAWAHKSNFQFISMLPKTGVPYKSNGYASEPDTNYDSDYALRYNSVDRKRTTSTGNQNDEKWVDFIWFSITKTKKAFDMAQWTPMGARSFQIWFLRAAREAECHSVQESAGQNRALHARKLICVGKRSEAGNNRWHPASPTNIDSPPPRTSGPTLEPRPNDWWW